jgi:hypothetical protein
VLMPVLRQVSRKILRYVSSRAFLEASRKSIEQKLSLDKGEIDNLCVHFSSRSRLQTIGQRLSLSRP